MSAQCCQVAILRHVVLDLDSETYVSGGNLTGINMK
jgi:hypothetical protein